VDQNSQPHRQPHNIEYLPELFYSAVCKQAGKGISALGSKSVVHRHFTWQFGACASSGLLPHLQIAAQPDHPFQPQKEHQPI